MILPPKTKFVNIQYDMDTYDNDPKPYGKGYWTDFWWLAMLVGIVLAGYYVPKWLG